METTVVRIPDGLLRGIQDTNLDGGKFYSFLGIPYAKPPVGDLKFKAPQPLEPWIGIRDSTKEGDISMQKNSETNMIEGSEDCLNLNLFTRELPAADDPLKPVMFWIHGGNRCTGSNRRELYGPEYLMTQDIVLVVINYRLGFLGFLQLDDESLGVPGNAGLKDQLLALKWVNKNINYFGGDPSNVTLFGNSAGGFFVHFHLLSPSSRGLFHKAIMQSGTAVVPAYGYQNPYEFVEQIGKTATTDDEILEIFKYMPLEELIEHQVEYLRLFKSTIGPVVEKPNQTAFLCQSPNELFFSGGYTAVPVMLGYCSKEELLFLGEIEKPDPSIFVPPMMNLKKGEQISDTICEMLNDFYYEGDNAGRNYLLHADAILLSNIMVTAKHLVRTSQYPVYFYRISLDGGLNLHKKKMKIGDVRGASHSDEIGYLFKVSCVPDMVVGKFEEKAIRSIVELWTNFAKYGNPTPDKPERKIRWDPIGNDFNFLDIGSELVMYREPEAKRMQLWKNIFDLHPSTSGFL